VGKPLRSWEGNLGFVAAERVPWELSPSAVYNRPLPSAYLFS
jgi:hypothetical protein